MSRRGVFEVAFGASRNPPGSKDEFLILELRTGTEKHEVMDYSRVTIGLPAPDVHAWRIVERGGVLECSKANEGLKQPPRCHCNDRQEQSEEGGGG